MVILCVTLFILGFLVNQPYGHKIVNIVLWKMPFRTIIAIHTMSQKIRKKITGRAGVNDPHWNSCNMAENSYFALIFSPKYSHRVSLSNAVTCIGRLASLRRRHFFQNLSHSILGNMAKKGQKTFFLPNSTHIYIPVGWFRPPLPPQQE